MANVLGHLVACGVTVKKKGEATLLSTLAWHNPKLFSFFILHWSHWLSLIQSFMKTYGLKEKLMGLPPPCLSSRILPALIPALIYSTLHSKKWLTLSSGGLSLIPRVTRNMQRHNFSPGTVTESSYTGEHTSRFGASFNVTHKSTLQLQTILQRALYYHVDPRGR